MSTYTQEQFDHYMEVGSDSRFEYCMIKQLMEENKRLTSSCAKVLLEADNEGHRAIVASHNALEDELAELNALLDQVTS